MTVLNEEIEWTTLAKNIEVANASWYSRQDSVRFRHNALSLYHERVGKERHTRKRDFQRQMVAGLEMVSAELTHWRTTNVSAKQAIRGRMAVTTSFNKELDSFVQIILSKPVYCWKGIARHQYDTVTGVIRFGGGTQLYVPNLASDRDGLSSGVAYMHCFTAIESLG